MKNYTNKTPEFCDVIKVMEPTDTNHADNVNVTTQQIMDNTLYLHKKQEANEEYLASCGKVFVQNGSFAIDALGIDKESTLKELCEAMLVYRSENKLPLVEVNFWINGSSTIGEEIRELLPGTYGNLNLSCPADTVYLTYRGYYSETPMAIRTCTYTKVNNKHDFSPWTKLEDMTATVERLERSIEEAKALRASFTAHGMTKVTNSAAVTDSTGLALAATEKNATIEGTLANQLAQLNTDYSNGWKTNPDTYVPVTYGEGFAAINDVDQVRCSHLLNGLRCITGAMTTTKEIVTSERITVVFTVPSAFALTAEDGMLYQKWISAVDTASGEAYNLLFSGNSVYGWGGWTVPAARTLSIYLLY